MLAVKGVLAPRLLARPCRLCAVLAGVELRRAAPRGNTIRAACRQGPGSKPASPAGISAYGRGSIRRCTFFA